MVAGWPIAHHVWAGNWVDKSTVPEAIGDLHRLFGFNRLVFVGDRGTVTDDNLESIIAQKNGYPWASSGGEIRNWPSGWVRLMRPSGFLVRLGSPHRNEPTHRALEHRKSPRESIACG